MPRANRRAATPRPLDLGRALGGAARREPYAGGEWFVRQVSGADGARTYRCPGCQQQLSGIPHVVVWPADGLGDLTDRRHWHTPCWRERATRPPLGSYR